MKNECFPKALKQDIFSVSENYLYLILSQKKPKQNKNPKTKHTLNYSRRGGILG